MNAGYSFCDFADYGDGEHPVCRDCGAPITAGHERCSSCAAFYRAANTEDLTRVYRHRVHCWYAATAPAAEVAAYVATLHSRLERAVAECRKVA